MVKTIFLTMSDDLFAALEQARKHQGYLTNQELVNSCVRRYVLDSKKNKGGRPKTPSNLDAFSDPTAETKKLEKELNIT